MGPKKIKEASDENTWRTSIEREPLVDETWRVRVAALEPAGGDTDRLYLTKFEAFAALEKRFVIKNICRTETIFMINQLGGDKKVKDDNFRVFEEGQAYLKDKKDIPPDILALIIKHLILKMKTEYLYIKRQKLEVREGMKRESQTMVNKAEVKGSVSVTPEPPPPPPPLTSKKGKGTESAAEPDLTEPEEGKKYNTQLRVRGEEWRDRVYVDDFPEDGPNLYVALTGFTDPQLPGCLIRIGVPLSAIVQVRIDPTTVKIPSSLSKVHRRGQSSTEILMEKSLKFWEELQQLRISRESADDFINTAFIIFRPPYWNSENLTGNPDKIYDELCFLLYDVQDLTRQHSLFLENMDIINIPADSYDEHSNDNYRQLIEDLPLECVSIYSLLDSVLQTVTMAQEQDETVSSDSEFVTVSQLQTGVNITEKADKAKELVNKVFEHLRESEENSKQYRITYGEEFESHKDPTIINYGDSAKNNTFHLGNINLHKIVHDSLQTMPINNLWQNQEAPNDNQEVKLNFHVNVLLSCFEREDVETSELMRLMHLLSCRKLFNNRSSLHKLQAPPSTVAEFKNVFLKRSILAEPLPRVPSVAVSQMSGKPSITKNDDQSQSSMPEPEQSDEEYETKKIKCLFDCPDISELVSATEITNGTPMNHMIEDYEYFEDFSGVSAYQTILEAFNTFNCVDYKYCEVTNCIILMFYNSYDEDAISRNEWRCHLPTPLCLQDFFDFVLEEHYDWIKNEEKLYDEIFNADLRSETKFLVDPLAGKHCIQNTDPSVELLMEGSLKYKEMIELEELSMENTENKSPSSTDTGSKLTKKAKSAAPSSSPKTARTSFTAHVMESESSTEIPVKPFSGYNLGDRRVEFFGKEANYFCQDGTRVNSNYYMFIPYNLEYNSLNMVTGNGNCQVWVHKITGEDLPTEQVDVSESFRITGKDRIMFNLKKQKAVVSQIASTNSSTVPAERKSPITKTSVLKEPSLLSQQNEEKTYYSFCITWPTGLAIESVHEEKSSKISHIKLSYLTPIKNVKEDCRCISLQGEVVIFKTNGEIEVLRPDGSYIKITKYFKELVVSYPAPASEISSDKTKTKGKPGGKEKGKDKVPFIEETPVNIKPPEYQLVIDQFEVIETNGLKQKWVDGELIDVEKLLIRTATDYCLGEIFSRRRDGTNVLLNKDGIQIVTFPDGTRIISYFLIEDEEIYPEWTVDEMDDLDMCQSDLIFGDSEKPKRRKSFIGRPSPSMASVKKEAYYIDPKDRKDGYVSVQLIYTVEHNHFATVTVDKICDKITVDSPNGTSLTVDVDNHYNIELDHVTKASFDGENLHIDYRACSFCESNVNCDIKIRTDILSSALTDYKTWLKMQDCCGKKIMVNEEGGMNIVEEHYTEEELTNVETPGELGTPVQAPSSTTKSSVQPNPRNQCKEMSKAKELRFFVLQRDLNCSELVHRTLVEQHKAACRDLPWCTVDSYNTFGDHRRLLSVLTPVHLNETEKWLMNSKLSAKPQHLLYKDLKIDEGKGFYHWMRPYERFTPQPRKPPAALPPRQPKAFVLRTLEQQWTAKDRDNLKGGKELLRAILKYREVMETDRMEMLRIPLVDSRTLQERETDELVQALGHRIYEELKQKLADDVESRKKADVTTVAPPPPEEPRGVGEECVYETDHLEEIEDRRQEGYVKDLETLVPPSGELERYWRCRAEELKEEEFHKYLLREGTVPAYFNNVLGGAIWWDMNAAAGDAVDRSERKKMRCVCHDEESTAQSIDQGFQ